MSDDDDDDFLRPYLDARDHGRNPYLCAIWDRTTPDERTRCRELNKVVRGLLGARVPATGYLNHPYHTRHFEDDAREEGFRVLRLMRGLEPELFVALAEWTGSLCPGSLICHAAMDARCYEALPLLLSRIPGALEQCGTIGETLLATAVMYSPTDVCRDLIERGARFDCVDGCGLSLLASANWSDKNDNEDAFMLLYAYGARELGHNRITSTEVFRHNLRTAGERWKKCADACVVVRGLGMARSSVAGSSNGRDVLRLVMRAVWVYRVHEAWDGGGKRVKESKRASR